MNYQSSNRALPQEFMKSFKEGVALSSFYVPDHGGHVRASFI